MELLSADSGKSSQDSDSTPFEGQPGVDGVGSSRSAPSVGGDAATTATTATWEEHICGKGVSWADVESPMQQHVSGMLLQKPVCAHTSQVPCTNSQDTQQCTQQLQWQQHFQAQSCHPLMVQGQLCMPLQKPVCAHTSQVPCTNSQDTQQCTQQLQWQQHFQAQSSHPSMVQGHSGMLLQPPVCAHTSQVPCTNSQDTQQCTQQLQWQQHFQAQSCHPLMVQGQLCMPLQKPVCDQTFQVPCTNSQDTQQCTQQLQLQQHFQVQSCHPSMVQGQLCMPLQKPVCDQTSQVPCTNSQDTQQLQLQLFGNKPSHSRCVSETQSAKSFASSSSEVAYSSLCSQDPWVSEASEVPSEDRSHFSSSTKKIPQPGKQKDTRANRLPAKSTAKVMSPQSEIADNNLCFLIKDAKELSDLNFVKESGFQNDVKKFLNDPDLTWTCLAGVRKPDYQKGVSYGISDQDSKILGLVAIKSFQTSHTPLKICCGIWLQQDDPKLIGWIMKQVVLQVFGKKPLFQNNDVRRNHISLEGVEEMTEIEAEICCCFKGKKDDAVSKSISLKDALKPDGLKLLQETFKRSNMKLTGTSLDFTDYADIVASKLQKPNVPKPEIREKLLTGCTDSLRFLIRNAKELANLDMVQNSGFQSEVQEFLNDPDLTWTCLAGVRKPEYQKRESYGISGSDSKILGLVAIKSSDGTVAPLRISARIWLPKKNLNVIRRIIAQIVLQVFGANPMHKNHDVRRNHHTMEDVFKETPIEAVVRCFCDESHKGENDENEKGLVIKLNQADPDSLQKALESHHFTLKGQEQDFSKYADLVAKRLKVRPDIKWKTIKDFKGDWLPGNLFQLIISEQLAFDLEKTGGYRKELDRQIVVLLPFHDCDGCVVKEAKHVLVAPVDTKRRAIYLVPRITLHPVSADPQTVDSVEQYLSNKYKYKVLVKSGDTWEKARLGLQVVGGGDGGSTCMVNFDADGEKALPQSVKASDLRLARALPGIDGELGEGREVATLVSSQETGHTYPTQRSFVDLVHDAEIMKHVASGFADSISFLEGKPEDLSNLDMLSEVGFQSEVQEFLKDDDPEFPWTCLAGVSEPPDQSNENNGTSDNQKNPLGVVAIKSSSGFGTPLKVRAAIWLRREDRRVLRGIIAQIVLQVFGKAPLHENSDVRRNRFTLRGIDKATQTEAHLCCFIKNEGSQQIEKPQPKEDLIDLKNMCGKDGRSLLKTAFSSLNLTLTGEEQDFLSYADVVAQMKMHCFQPVQVVSAAV